jgi:hypothetical protein
MTTHKGHYTVHASENPHLAEILAGEPSARRRARLLVKYAEFGCMLQKMGLPTTNGALPASGAPCPVVHVSDALDVGSGSVALRGVFFDNLIAGYMSPVSDAPVDEAGGTDRGTKIE